ncbi:hypothetical protein [Streptomyces chryseus]|uniref:hypothetical protein n=1 Tax=Streptomyces chryseus TaxID=68186 RepID=UPI0019C72EFB|nr:hypothetical protein [Streptomyces chryseus]GGX02148.1 hypothetical protein GCM10010353_17280 [Streptomyces chryseus]
MRGSAALDVTADDEPLPAAAARGRREPNRLDWCLREGNGGIELKWLGAAHPADCPHGHVLDHQCTGPVAGPPTRKARTRAPRVPDGQLTL